MCTEPHRWSEVADGAVERVRIGDRRIGVQIHTELGMSLTHAIPPPRVGRRCVAGAFGSSVATRPSAWVSTHCRVVGSMPVSKRASGALTYTSDAAPTMT